MTYLKRYFLIFIFCISQEGYAQDFKPVKFEQIEEILNSNNDTLYVINFWATWCKPCVAELPYFDELTTTYENKKVKVILVSLDFKSEIKEKLPAFLEEKQLKSEVWWFSEEKQGDFIEKIEPSWYGAIPFTLLLKGSSNYRFAKEGKWEKENLLNKVAKNL